MIEKAKRGEKVDTKIAPRMLPIIVTESEWGALCTGIYIHRTDENKCQISGNLNVTIDEPFRIGSAPQLNLKGIILNPDTDKMILHPKFIDAMKQVKAAQTQPQPKPGVQGQEKDIKMSRAQFELFARRTCEWGNYSRGCT